jgi:hypothetical protein
MYGRDYYAKKKATTEAAFSDLKMIQSIAKTMTRPFELAPRQGPVSLNATSRKQELFRITMQNHQLLNSLEALKPVISTRDLLRRSAQNQRYVVNSSHSMRKAGGYDHLIQHYRRENLDAREAQLRRWKSDPAFTTGSTVAPEGPVSAGESMGASSGSAGSRDKPRKPPPGTKLETLPTSSTGSADIGSKPEQEPESALVPEDTVSEPTEQEAIPISESAPEEQESEEKAHETQETTVPAPLPSDDAEVEISADVHTDLEGSPEIPSEIEQAAMTEEEAPKDEVSVKEEEKQEAILSESMEYTSESPPPDASESPAPVEGFPSAPEVLSAPEADSAPELSAEEAPPEPDAPPEPAAVGLGGLTERPVSEPKQNSDGSSGYNQDDFEDSKDLENTEGIDASAKEEGTYDYDTDFVAESPAGETKDAMASSLEEASASAQPTQPDAAETDQDAFEQSRADLDESEAEPTSPEGKSGKLGATHTSESFADDYDDDFAEDSGALDSP